jgi:hypothetical protein
LGFLDFFGILDYGNQMLMSLGIAAIIMIIIYIIAVSLIKKRE